MEKLIKTPPSTVNEIDGANSELHLKGKNRDRWFETHQLTLRKDLRKERDGKKLVLKQPSMPERHGIACRKTREAVTILNLHYLLLPVAELQWKQKGWTHIQDAGPESTNLEI